MHMHDVISRMHTLNLVSSSHVKNWSAVAGSLFLFCVFFCSLEHFLSYFSVMPDTPLKSTAATVMETANPEVGLLGQTEPTAMAAIISSVQAAVQEEVCATQVSKAQPVIPMTVPGTPASVPTRGTGELLWLVDNYFNN